jgi:hypothetical protein
LERIGAEDIIKAGKESITPLSKSIYETYADVCVAIKKGLVDQAHNEVLYESIMYPAAFTKYGSPMSNMSYISVTVSNLAALSKGNVTISSNNALGDPVINPNVSRPFTPPRFR